MPVLCENSPPRASTMLLENYRYAQRQMKIVGGYVGKKGSGECKAVYNGVLPVCCVAIPA